MATGHFFKTWEDVGAPQLNNGAGNLITMLDWALDTTGAVYWEKVYTGTNKAAYRSKTGFRPYLRVDDTRSDVAYIEMYETMTDVDTGTSKTPDGITQTIPVVWMKGQNTNATGYWIWGDSEFFNIIVEADNRYRSDNLYPQNVRFGCFGELATYPALDNYPCLVAGSKWDSDTCQYNLNSGNLMGNASYGFYSTAWTNSASYTTPLYSSAYWLKTADGVNPSSGAYIFTDSYSRGAIRMDKDNPFWHWPLYVADSYKSLLNDSRYFFGWLNSEATVRARLPYIYGASCLMSAAYGGPELTQQDTVTIGSSQFLAFHSKDGATNSFYEPNISRTYLLRQTNDEPDRP